jgi:hypothetical protein
VRLRFHIGAVKGVGILVVVRQELLSERGIGGWFGEDGVQADRTGEDGAVSATPQETSLSFTF